MANCTAVVAVVVAAAGGFQNVVAVADPTPRWTDSLTQSQVLPAATSSSTCCYTRFRAPDPAAQTAALPPVLAGRVAVFRLMTSRAQTALAAVPVAVVADVEVDRELEQVVVAVRARHRTASLDLVYHSWICEGQTQHC